MANALFTKCRILFNKTYSFSQLLMWQSLTVLNRGTFPRELQMWFRVSNRGSMTPNGIATELQGVRADWRF